MKQRTRTALGIGVLTTLVAALGAGLFVTGNTQIGVYVVVGGIPLLLLGGAVAYVRGVVGGEGNTGQFVEQRAKQVGGSLRDVWRSLTAIEERYPRFDASTLRTRAESLAADYESEGGEFDRDSGSFSVGRNASRAELQELERIDDELDALAADRDDELHEFVRDELDALEANVQSLADAGLAADPPTPRSPPTPAEGGPSGVDYHDAVGEPLDAYREDADEIVADAIASVREIRRSATGPIDEDAVESRLEAADAARADGEYATAVDDVLEARSELESELSGSFDQDRSALLSLAAAVLESDADRFVAIDPFDTVREVKRELEGLDSALDVAALTRHRRSMRSATREIVTSLESSLADAVNTLDGEDLPAGYYSRPDAADVDYASELADAESIEDLEAAWQDAVDGLVPAVDTVQTKSTVVDAYPDVSETIEETLQRSGTVTADDLPVRHAEQFFGLYFRRNPSVEFDPDAPAIHRGDVATHTVTVTVSFDEGSEDKRSAVVELSNQGFDATEVVETHLVGDVQFADVPAGEYDVAIRPRDDEYPTAERTVTVDGDTSLSVDVEPVGLYEELVGDREAEMREHVGEFGPRLEERFADEGYLHTDAEYPIADEVVPGLLAAWADEQGYDLARGDGTVYVYDPEQLSQEIMNVIKYNIDDGEAISYDDVRSNFLSTPVPNEVIAALADDTTLDVTATDTGLEKATGGEE